MNASNETNTDNSVKHEMDHDLVAQHKERNHNNKNKSTNKKRVSHDAETSSHLVRSEQRTVVKSKKKWFHNFNYN